MRFDFVFEGLEGAIHIFYLINAFIFKLDQISCQ